MHPSVLERALHLFPEIDFVNAYGLTETSSTVAHPRPRRPPPRALQRRAAVHRTASASVGQPVPGIEIRIVDDDGRRPRPRRARRDPDPGRPGRAATYVGTDSKVDADGWLHTGDRGWLDIEGYLFCEGRADDTIIRGGENIGPAEVEDALLQHDAISIAAVVGLPDEEWGETHRGDDHAAARRRRRSTSTTCATGSASASARSRPPRPIEVVDELPQTATGKILRRQVQRRPRRRSTAERRAQRSSRPRRRAARRPSAVDLGRAARGGP